MGHSCPGAQFLSWQRAIRGAVLSEALLLAKEQVNSSKVSLSEPIPRPPPQCWGRSQALSFIGSLFLSGPRHPSPGPLSMESTNCKVPLHLLLGRPQILTKGAVLQGGECTAIGVCDPWCEPQLLTAGMTTSQSLLSLGSLKLNDSMKTAAHQGAPGTKQSGAQTIGPPSTELSGCAKHSAEHLTDLSSSNPNSHPGGQCVNAPISQARKSRLREVKRPVQGHTASKWWDGDSNPGLRDCKAHNT